MTRRDFPPIHPGEILLEDFLQPMQISPYRLAQAIGVPPRRMSVPDQDYDTVGSMAGCCAVTSRCV
jgi:hypothetical protein